MDSLILTPHACARTCAASTPTVYQCFERPACLRWPAPSGVQELTAYKKFREKAVSSAARGLISLFRWGALVVAAGS